MKKLLYLLIFISFGASAQRSISLKVASVDTSLAFANYIRTANYGTVKTLQALGVDTTLISTKANNTASLLGYTPMSRTLTINGTAFDLTANRSFSVGTVTSVAASVPAFLSVSGSPITTSGTLAITLSGTALPVANGGTGLTTLTSNTIYKGNGTTALAASGLSDNGTTISTTEAFSSGAITSSGLINTTAGNGISAGGNSFAVSPSATRGVININGSTDQFLTFAGNGYLLGSSTLMRLLSTPDLDFAVGGSQRLLISASTGAATFSSSVAVQSSTASTSTSTGALVVTGGVGVGGILNAGGVAGSQVAASQLMTSPQYTTGIVPTITDGATITYDCLANGQYQKVTLGGNRTLSMTNLTVGTTYTLMVKQDATGSRTLTMPSGTKVSPGGSGVVTFSTAANAVDILTLFWDGLNLYATVNKNFN